jgi:hypothetical protein
MYEEHAAWVDFPNNGQVLQLLWTNGQEWG